MGGLIKKPTIGFKNYLSFMLGIGYPVDRLTRIIIDGRDWWSGNMTAGLGYADKPNHFGGEKKGGGFSGWFNFLTGAADQERNDHMQSLLGDEVSAFRRISSLIFRQPYVGNSTTLPTIAVQVSKTETGMDGSPIWRPDIAEIGGEVRLTDTALYIAIDVSANGGEPNSADLGEAVADWLALIKENDPNGTNDIRIVKHGFSVIATYEKRKAKAADYDAAIAFCNDDGPVDFFSWNMSPALASAPLFFNGSTSYTIPNPFYTGDFLSLPNLFIPAQQGATQKRKVAIILTRDYGSNWPDPLFPPGNEVTKEYADQIPGLEVYAYSYYTPDVFPVALDNTDKDGVPVTGYSKAGIYNALVASFKANPQLNPAHAFRDMFVSDFPGIGLGEAGVDPSINEVAELFYAEGFGISYAFDSSRPRAEFLDEICSTVNAIWGVNPFTGQAQIVPIRPDYDVDDIHVIDDDDIVEIEEFRRRKLDAATNAITVRYRDPRTGQEAAVTRDNPALVAFAGRIHEELDFPFVWDHNLAARIAEREVHAASLPLASGTILVRRAWAGIARGAPFRLSSNHPDIGDVVARVMNFKASDGDKGALVIEFTEDVYAMPSTATGVVITEPDREGDASAVEIRAVEEAPFIEVVRALGEDEAIAQIGADQSMGFMVAAGVAPDQAFAVAQIAVDEGSGFAYTEEMAFAPGGEIVDGLSRDPTQVGVILPTPQDGSGLAVGSLAKIGTEFVKITDAAVGDPLLMDSALINTPLIGTVYSLTVARGVVDTVPEEHNAGAGFIQVEGYYQSNGVDYVAGQDIDVRLLTSGPSTELALADAPNDNILFASRAARPLPPGNVKGDGEYVSVSYIATEIDMTWAWRNRLSQTVSDYLAFTAGSVTIEPGTTHLIKVRNYDTAGDEIGVSAAVELADTYAAYTMQIDDPHLLDAILVETMIAGGLYADATSVKVEVWSRRDGLESWTGHGITGAVLAPPGDLVLTEV